MTDPWATPTDPTAQVEHAAGYAPAQAPELAPANIEHFADHIPRARWERATWLNQPDPIVIEVLMDGTLGLAMCVLGVLAVLALVGPLGVLVWLGIVLEVTAKAVARSWRYRRHTWPTMYRLAHGHALPPVAGVPKRWVPGGRRQLAYLEGRLP